MSNSWWHTEDIYVWNKQELQVGSSNTVSNTRSCESYSLISFAAVHLPTFLLVGHGLFPFHAASVTFSSWFDVTVSLAALDFPRVPCDFSCLAWLSRASEFAWVRRHELLESHLLFPGPAIPSFNSPLPLYSLKSFPDSCTLWLCPWQVLGACWLSASC